MERARDAQELPAGVEFYPNKKNKYRARIRMNGKSCSLGYFMTTEEAAKAVVIARPVRLVRAKTIPRTHRVRGFENLANRVFGRLTVKEYIGLTKHRKALWLCSCVCGNEKPILAASLKNGTTSSCGCLNREITTNRNFTTGDYLKYQYLPEFNSWRSMLQRCTNQNVPNYQWYGGAGVKISPEWMTMEGFLADMTGRPSGTTLGRILDMGNYEQGNAFWQTKEEQQLARRNKYALLKWAGAQ